jgi:hypothetical protein
VLHNPSPRRPSAGIPILLGILLALLVAVPALADYLGPNRAVTVWEWNRLRCRYQAVYDPPGSGWYGCTLELYETPDGSCPGDVAGYFSSAYCGWPEPFCQTRGCSINLSAAVVSCSEGEEGCRAVERTVMQPEATVAGSVSCAVSGNGGWCRGGAEVSVSGSEPMSGYTILALEGTRNGETFACPGAACGVPLVEGGNEFTFWAVSSWGDTSRIGTASGSLDSQAPVISGELSGTTGDNGWFVSEVTLTASASDAAPGSGLMAFELSLDGGGWSAYSGSLTLGEGEHTVDLRAQDVAGNVSTESQSVNVDAQSPDVNLSANASFCPGCGETLEITLDVQDGGSGVVEWTLGSDAGLVASGSGATSQVLTWDGGGLPGGTHTLTLGARDAAGNAAETSLPVSVVVPTAVPHPTEVPTEEPPPGSTSVSPTAVQSPTPGPGPTATQTAEAIPFGGIPAAPVGGGGGDTIVNPPSEILGGPQPLAPTSSTGVLWGAAALAVTSAATAVALDQARRRRDEEARKAAEMRRKNAEAEAREEEQRRSLAAMLAAAAASAAAQVRTTAGNTVSGATTALTERWYERRMDRLEDRWEREQAEARERAREAARQQAMRATAAATASQMVARLGEDARQRAAAIARAERLRQIAEARDVPAVATQQPTTTPTPPSTATPQPWAIRTVGPYVTPGSIQVPWAAGGGRAWWQRVIDRVILSPPTWLSLSYHLERRFSLGNWAIDEFVSRQPSPEGLVETLFWQEARLGTLVSERITSNPSGWVDVNFSNGRLTLRGRPNAEGVQVGFFLQPGSLSFGWTNSSPLAGQLAMSQTAQSARAVNITTVDFDIGGQDWLSFKVSEASGVAVSERHPFQDGEFQITNTTLDEVSIQTHRWPRTAVVLVGVPAAVRYAWPIVVPVVAEAGRAVLAHLNPAWAPP